MEAQTKTKMKASCCKPKTIENNGDDDELMDGAGDFGPAPPAAATSSTASASGGVGTAIAASTSGPSAASGTVTSAVVASATQPPYEHPSDEI